MVVEMMTICSIDRWRTQTDCCVVSLLEKKSVDKQRAAHGRRGARRGFLSFQHGSRARANPICLWTQF